MHNKNSLYFCRVCGLEQEDAPWGANAKTPSYNICDCCGVEFGYEDSRLESIRIYRSAWIQKGMDWFLKKNKPNDWCFEKNIKNIPEEYL